MAEPVLPHLPPRDNNTPWSGNVQQSFQLLGDAFRRGHAVLALQNADPLQYHLCIELITRDMVPILRAMEENAAVEGLSAVWVNAVTRRFVTLLLDLKDSVKHAENRCVIHFIIL